MSAISRLYTRSRSLLLITAEGEHEKNPAIGQVCTLPGTPASLSLKLVSLKLPNWLRLFQLVACVLPKLRHFWQNTRFAFGSGFKHIVFPFRGMCCAWTIRLQRRNTLWISTKSVLKSIFRGIKERKLCNTFIHLCFLAVKSCRGRGSGTCCWLSCVCSSPRASARTARMSRRRKEGPCWT